MATNTLAYSGISNEQNAFNKLQHDLLALDLNNNPHLKHDAIYSLNKALDTDNKNIIGAINELTRRLSGVEGTGRMILKNIVDILGNSVANPETKQQILESYPSVIEAVADLMRRVTYIERVQLKNVNERFQVANTGQTQFHLKYTPDPGTVVMHVNGTRYDENEDFTVDYNTNIVEWRGSFTLGGFVVIEYSIFNSEEEDG